MLAKSNNNGVSWQHGEVGVIWNDLSDSTIKIIVSKYGGDSFDSPITLSKQPYPTVTDSQFFENHL